MSAADPFAQEGKSVASEDDDDLEDDLEEDRGKLLVTRMFRT